MSELIDKFRGEVTKLDELSTQLYEAPDFASSPVKQSLFVVSKLRATIFSAWAEVLADTAPAASNQPAPSAPETPPAETKHEHKVIDRTAAVAGYNERLTFMSRLRTAAAQGFAKGDYSEFDKLVTGNGGSGSPAPENGAGTGSGSSPGGNGAA